MSETEKTQEKTKTKTKNQNAETQGGLEVVPQFKMRGKQRLFHHLFKAMLATFKKNKSWVKGRLDMVEIEHVHFYHSINSMGMKQEHTTTVGGHFHRVTWEIGENGEPVAKCGPPLKKLVKAKEDGSQKTNIVPVRFYAGKEVNDETGEERERWIVDTHTHDMRYDGTDELTSEMIRETQKGTAETLNAIQPKPIEGFTSGDR